MSEEWVEASLDDVAHIQQGKTLAVKDMTGGPHPVYGANGVIGYFTRGTYDFPTVALGCRGSCGTVTIAPPGAFLANNVMAVWPQDDHVVSTAYLALALESADLVGSGVISGQVQPQITRRSLALLRISLPSRKVQRRITDLMAHLDDHLATLRVEREAVHGIWLAMINSSFSNNTWPRVPIGEVVAAGGGRLVDGDWIESKDQAPEGIRLLQLADLSRGRFLNKSERFVSRETFQRLHCTDIKKGDLLISRMADPIGRTSRVPDDLEGSIAAVDIAILTPGLDLDGDYLLGILNSTPWIETCDTRGTGTTRKRISKGNLAKIEIPVPDLSAQQRLGVGFAGCVATIEYIDLEVSAVEGLRHRLLAALLGGHACIADSYDSLLQGVA